MVKEMALEMVWEKGPCNLQSLAKNILQNYCAQMGTWIHRGNIGHPDTLHHLLDIALHLQHCTWMMEVVLETVLELGHCIQEALVP